MPPCAVTRCGRTQEPGNRPGDRDCRNIAWRGAVTLDRIRIGFLPLVDAALPILARECGFAEAEGLEIELVRDMTWATVRDRLLYGHTDAAHMIAPLAIATSLGRDRPAIPLS